MANRRNYYRVLHVQPEAPDEIIKASYRTLMTKLGAHPDRGGDNATAALLNEAYAVLRDPARRRAYDQSLQRQGNGLSQRRAATGRTAPPAATNKASPATSTNDEGGCPFCRAPLPASMHADGPCSRCGSPLEAPKAPPQKRGELFGRRGVTRIAKSDLVTVYPTWPHAGVGARLRDLSATGISLMTSLAPVAGQTLKIAGPAIEAIARVVSVRRSGNLYAIHARLLTATFPHVGAFVSARV